MPQTPSEIISAVNDGSILIGSLTTICNDVTTLYNDTTLAIIAYQNCNSDTLHPVPRRSNRQAVHINELRGRITGVKTIRNARYDDKNDVAGFQFKNTYD